MGIFVAAWLFGEGIVVYRWTRLGAPPTPGALLKASFIFAGLAVLADYAPARGLAVASAVGVDLAVLVQVLGKAPTGATGWPPPVMDNASTAVFPSGPSSQTGAAPAAAAGTSASSAGTRFAGSGPPSTTVPGLPTGSRGSVLG